MKRDLEVFANGTQEEYREKVIYSPYAIDELSEQKQRRIYLQGEINSLDSEERYDEEKTTVARVVRLIMKFNREDAGIEISERKPIQIYINSPGGEVYEGFSLISAIETSKTPVYTYNIGQWSSMAFLIGISGHRRYSLPNMVFLMHDGSNFMYGSTGKVQDKAKFHERYEQEVIKKHILRHSNMKDAEYDILTRVEYYMLPEDALSHGFIDKIASSIDEIL